MNNDIKKIRDFFRFRVQNWEQLSNYPDSKLKKSHGLRGRNALKKLGVLLELEEMKVDYNPSGVIDGGYLILIGMKGEKGIYISLSCSSFGKDVLYRTVKHMKDYRGGSNNFFISDDLVNDTENCIRAIEKLLK